MKTNSNFDQLLNIKKMLNSEDANMKKQGTKELLSIPVIFSNIEYIVNRYAANYAMPEIELNDKYAKEDYLSELKISYIEGLLKGIKQIDINVIPETKKMNTVMAYISKIAKHNMLFGEHGVLNYMKMLYPEATEYYVKTLVKIHKNEILEKGCKNNKCTHIKNIPTTELKKAVGGSLKTALKIHNIFDIPSIERYENVKVALSYTTPSDRDVILNKLMLDCKSFFSEEEMLIIDTYIKTKEKKGNTIIINLFKKYALQYLIETDYFKNFRI